MITRYVYLLFVDGVFFAKAFSEDLALHIFQTLKEVSPIGTVLEMRTYKLMEVKKIDK